MVQNKNVVNFIQNARIMKICIPAELILCKRIPKHFMTHFTFLSCSFHRAGERVAKKRKGLKKLLEIHPLVM